MSRITTKFGPIFTQEVIDILRSHGLKTSLAVISADPDRIHRTTGIPYKDVLTIREALMTRESAPVYTAARLLDKVMAHSAVYSTRVASLDGILGGGISRGEVTEFVGRSSSGKTQLCHQIAAIVASAGGHVLYVDSTGSFQASRLVQMLKGFPPPNPEQSESSILSRVEWILCTEPYVLLDILHRDMIKQKAVVIIDSLMTIMMPSLLGPNRCDGQGLLNQVAVKLKYLAAVRMHSIIVTNGIVGSRISDQEWVERPGMGRYWQHVPHVRLHFTRSSATGDRVVARVEKSRRSTTGKEAALRMTETGLHAC